MDRDTVCGTVVEYCMPFEVLYASPELFKRHLEIFARRRLPVWDKLYQSTVQRYSMLDDVETDTEYSGQDTDTRTPDITRTRTPNLTTEGHNSGSDSTEQQVAAFNSNDYANREKQTTTLGTANTVHSTGTETEVETGNEQTVRAKGTKVHSTGRNRPAAELLKAEREAALFDVVDFIATDIKCNFCLLLY